MNVKERMCGAKRGKQMVGGRRRVEGGRKGKSTAIGPGSKRQVRVRKKKDCTLKRNEKNIGW